MQDETQEFIENWLRTHWINNKCVLILYGVVQVPTVTSWGIYFCGQADTNLRLWAAKKLVIRLTSPEHLYQNYTIDVLVKDEKSIPIFTSPWYNDLEKLIRETQPSLREIDESQLDTREDFDEIEEWFLFYTNA